MPSDHADGCVDDDVDDEEEEEEEGAMPDDGGGGDNDVPCNLIWVITLVVITGTAMTVLYIYAKSLQLIWMPGTPRFRLRLPELTSNDYRDLTIWEDARMVAPAMAGSATCVIALEDPC